MIAKDLPYLKKTEYYTEYYVEEVKNGVTVMRTVPFDINRPNIMSRECTRTVIDYAVQLRINNNKALIKKYEKEISDLL